MRKPRRLTTGVLGLLPLLSWASPELLEQHCGECHNDEDLKGELSLSDFAGGPSDDNIFIWEDSLDFVSTSEMPPADEVDLADSERERIVAFLTETVRQFHEADATSFRAPPRRLNNRELVNSVRDVLLIENIGTHQPAANLLGDTLHDGFDTHGESLGMSQFHLEQYIASLRKIVDGVIQEGKRPTVRRVNVPSDKMGFVGRSRSFQREEEHRTPESIDIVDMRNRVQFENFRTIKDSGRYRIRIRATGVDRGIYPEQATGTYHDDPIRLRVHLGDEFRDFDLPDHTVHEMVIDEWLTAGTRIEISYPTDGLKQIGNGNFKFQFRIGHDYLKQHNTELYERVVREEVPLAKFRSTAPSHWVHWTKYWQGPRPRLFNADIEGPLYESWPSKRQSRLIGPNPSLRDAAEILMPIAIRAWRRDVQPDELAPIVELMHGIESTEGTLAAFKEGIVALMVSPSFLLANAPEGLDRDRFASKLSLFLQSSIPSADLRMAARIDTLNTFEGVQSEVARQFETGVADPFLAEFPHAWLQLDRINFMAPDPDHFPLYNRKDVSEDMIAEAVTFFQHVVAHNLPVTEFLSADYSFINADLAQVYGVKNVPQDSQLRRHQFHDGRRGGILGMGAFLTLTADSLGTSPIHRAIYVMENLLGIHPNPPPPDVEITEPDVRQAKTIKEILAAHTEEETCASCHRSIDPYGYAFENFDPQGGWREAYTMQIAKRPSREELTRIAEEDKRLAELGLPPVPKPWENKPIPIDSSETFRNGESYANIREYRELMNKPTNQRRFVRCFITKLLTYANGVEPESYWEIEKLVDRSAEHEYRIVDTIAAVIDSPLFRETGSTGTDAMLVAGGQ
ncbi:DUF1592 domain-containing protein [Opitutaceae bacterium]|nr:DUF1592 domain-containing protein [Opitutaceae bacterium]